MHDGAWIGERVARGEQGEVALHLSTSSSGVEIRIPVFVWRGREPGPRVFVSAAVHGDEINGAGAIREIIVSRPFEVVRGDLLLVPVVNIMGFDQHARYMPDRRDLNRSFPGSAGGSMASRTARAVFDAIVGPCDYGIDLHTAAVRRTNFPNVRADMENPVLANLARAFGTELIVSGKGPVGSLRRSACDAGKPPLILEAGEVWKVEPAVVEYAVRGIKNCLVHLGMVEGEVKRPAYQIVVDTTKWLRAEHGGFLQFHVAPGDIVEAGEALATNTSLTGERHNVIEAPRDGVVLGMTTLPSVAPGDPVCHLASPKAGALRKAGKVIDALPEDHLHERTREDLARNIVVQEHEEQG
ncbi:MAG: succinylglutamate desuccinylase/aspartoacylase family protein [Phycisphaerales bacterium JB059]